MDNLPPKPLQAAQSASLIHLLFLLGAHSLKPMLPSAPGWLQSGSPRHPGHPILPAADRVPGSSFEAPQSLPAGIPS